MTRCRVGDRILKESGAPAGVCNGVRGWPHINALEKSTGMAISFKATSPSKGVVVTVPMLVLAASGAAIFFFFLLSSLSTCSCPPGGVTRVSEPAGDGGSVADSVADRISTSQDDVEWVKDQIQLNGLQMQDNVLRKGINPRTRAQQLQDLVEYVIPHFTDVCFTYCTRLFRGIRALDFIIIIIFYFYVFEKVMLIVFFFFRNCGFH